jgi:hypothetical protein
MTFNRNKEKLFNALAKRLASKFAGNNGGGLKARKFKKDYETNLFGNKDNTDLMKVDKRNLEWEARLAKNAIIDI